jgi:excisionase family DNA binding protein
MTAFLTPAQVAEQLGTSHDTVLRAIHRGDLKAVVYGRLVRIHPDDLTAFLTAHSTRPSKARGRLRSTA